MIYFDMDGVLAQYKYIAYLGENPIWLRKEEHYFLNIEHRSFGGTYRSFEAK